jgi:TonB family protein
LPRKEVDVIGSTPKKISLPKDQKLKFTRKVTSPIPSEGGEPFIKISKKSPRYRIARKGKVVGGVPKVGGVKVGAKIKVKEVKRVVLKRRSPPKEGSGFQIPFELKEKKMRVAKVAKKTLPQKSKTEQKLKELIEEEKVSKTADVADVGKKKPKERKITLARDVEEMLKKRAEKKEIREVEKPPPKLVEIRGVLSKRKIERSFIPAYPEWAEKEGIEAEVAIRFAVSPEGFVVEAHISQTSGYGALDRLAVKALKQWVFSPLPEDLPRITQWGMIIFRFLLR